MLLSNNVDIPVDTVGRKIDEIYRYRRRSSPLFSNLSFHLARNSDSGAGFSNLITLPTKKFKDFRAFIKCIPLIGTIAVNLNRKKKAIFAPGLHWKVRIRLLPVIGDVAAWTYSIINLNKIRVNDVTRLDELGRMQDISKIDVREIRILIEKLKTKLDQIDVHFANEQSEVKKLNDDFVKFVGESQSDTKKLNDDFGRFSNLTATQILILEQQMARLTRQWRLLDMTMTVEPETSTGMAEVPKNSLLETARMANFYTEFEDVFRGGREDISQRLKIYVPYLNHFNNIENLPVLDIGCGRGEWLGILTQCGIKAVGIDLNIAMADTCKQLGFDVECGDAIKYLQQQPEGSLAAITGFHIIEHLSFEQLLALFDSALHALRPGGVVIFETPNPENILVGSCNFYYDPTHRHPIVPVVAEFIARQRGFASAEILRLHPYPDSHYFNEDSEIAKRLNTLLYGPQDYAILAWKTNAN